MTIDDFHLDAVRAVEQNRKDAARNRLYLRLGVTWACLVVLCFIAGVVLDVMTGSPALVVAAFSAIGATVVGACVLAMAAVWIHKGDR